MLGWEEATAFVDPVLVPVVLALPELEEPPPPHPVSTPAMIKEPATTCVHEWTPVLLIGTPRMTPFQMRLVRRSAPRRTKTGFTQGELPAHGRGRPSPYEIAAVVAPDEQLLVAIPAT